MEGQFDNSIKGIKPQGKPWPRFLIGSPAASGRGIKKILIKRGINNGYTKMVLDRKSNG
jgi:hypothetical protein